MSAFREYLSALRHNLAQGDSTEHTHRPALKELLQAFGTGVVATNEPRRTQCGAPDFKISRAGVPLGHIETKDVGTDLTAIERGRGAHTDQFQRYKTGLPNWILTNYLDFHWFVNGQRRLTASLARLRDDGKLAPEKQGETEVAQLLDAFLKQEAFTVGTARDLAQHMAHMTRLVRDQIVRAFDQEKDKGWLHTWLAAFREVLIPDLDEPKFADMFAQTLSYGLFAARVHTLNQKDFSREKAAFALPKTNPFLRKLFSEIAGVDMPETIEWAVNDLVELLRHAAMHEILKDFGKAKGKEDPVVHFYETFLSAYDPKMRELRGVYYTPEPVVSYIVRSVDYLLKTRFNRSKGLADENTLILDPAVGTATFLYFVIQRIYDQFASQRGAWDDYVSRHLLNRIYGFELLMAPYAVAHLKLGMQLQETGYQFASDQRLGIYLTNTLEEAAAKSEQLMAKFISDEANAAAAIKRDLPILVVLGNPPYSGHSANRSYVEREVSPGQSYTITRGGPKRSQISVVTQIARKKTVVREKTFIGQLMDDYYYVDDLPLGEKNTKWLQDDYVKFIRFAQWRIEKTGEGILGFITNHGYLDNPTFRGMRRSLLDAFTDIYVYDLHGSTKKKEVAPGAEKDGNVFDIQQGVAILVAVRRPGHKGPQASWHCDLWGTRESKYATLGAADVNGTPWTKLEPRSPDFLFVPEDADLRAEYDAEWSLPDIMPTNSIGIVTARDSLTIHFTREELWATIQDFVALPEDEARQKYNLGPDVRDWKVANAQRDLRNEGLNPNGIIPILYRPFDIRWTYYTGRSRGFHCYPRRDVMAHMMAGANIGIVTARANRSPQKDHFFCTTKITETKCGESTIQSYLFPLYLYPDEDRAQGRLDAVTGRQANVAPTFIEAITRKVGLAWVAEGHGDLTETLGPEDLISYAYAVFYSPGYRRRYSSFLTTQFPRLPLVSDRSIFRSLAQHGRELVSLHTLQSPKLTSPITLFPEKGSALVDKSVHTARDARVWINKTQYFEGVPPEVWEFHIGGYQVCEKWLKDRKGRQLSYDDIQHYQKVVVALKETIRLMTEIDALTPGWPLP